MSDGVSCKRDGCPGQGTWTPVMVMRPQEGRKPVTGSIPGIKICEMHKTESTLETFLSAEGWAKIEKFLRENGKGNFLRRSVRLEWKKNEEAALLPF